MFSIKKVTNINWKKIKGYIPSIIQHYMSGEVLMHGYMNEHALEETIEKKMVTFYSRTKARLWTKGETSGNYLIVKKILLDCDQDALLIKVNPIGQTCHLKQYSCFFKRSENFSFLYYLEKVINKRKKTTKKSYIFKLFNLGIERIAQKVGEESIETILASMSKNNNDLINEASDLIFHLLILLNYKKLQLHDIIRNLQNRNKKEHKNKCH